MQKLDLQTVPKLKFNPIFKDLPESLKDPKCFKRIEKKLNAILNSDHKHKTVTGYVTCAWCSEKRTERYKLMEKIGFTSIGQYMDWKKVMTIISKKKNFQVK